MAEKASKKRLIIIIAIILAVLITAGSIVGVMLSKRGGSADKEKIIIKYISSEGTTTATELTVNNRKNNPVTDSSNPTFAWKLTSTRRGDLQTAYRVGVASSEENIKNGNYDIWDSGRVKSSDMSCVYGANTAKDGKTAVSLTPQTQYYWTVTVFDYNGEAIATDEIGSFTTGLFGNFGESNKWICLDGGNKENAAVLFRRQFTLEKSAADILSAKLYSTAAGSQIMYINGEKAANEYMAPGKSQYTTVLYYQTYDITDKLTNGDNTVAAEVGNGWYCAGAVNTEYGTNIGLKAKLVITYKDGSSQQIDTDSSWLCTDNGHTTENKYYLGQSVDATKKIENWNKNNSNSALWKNAKAEESFITDKGYNIGPSILAAENEPVVNTEKFNPVSVTDKGDSRFVYKLSQNIVGTLRITASAPRGTKITVSYCEYEDMDSFRYNNHNGTDTYIFSGNGKETVEFDLAYHGFQYIMITGLGSALDFNDIEALVLTSDIENVGEFESSDELVNKFHQNVLWSLKGNFVSTITDCPTREKNTWAGDAAIITKASTYLLNSRNIYENFQNFMVLSQGINGATGVLVPSFTNANDKNVNSWASAGWSDAIVTIPYNLYTQYGDLSILERNYSAMKKYMDYLITRKTGQDESDLSKYFVCPTETYGDHLAYYNGKRDAKHKGTYVQDKDFGACWRETSYDEIGTAYAAYLSDILSTSAAALGNTQDAEYYSDIREKYAAAWRTNFLADDGISTKSNSQTSYALGIAFNCYKSEDKAAAAQKLAELIQKEDYDMTVGFLGINILYPALSENGQFETALKLFTQSEKVTSLLYYPKNGYTTIPENYGVGMSLNHFVFGAPVSWLYECVLGIFQSDSVGFREFELNPTWSNDENSSLTYAKGTYNSVCGKISSSWEKKDGKVYYTCTVPANSTATVSLPASDSTHITESGKEIENADGIKFLKKENGRNYYFVVSGTFEFVIE